MQIEIEYAYTKKINETITCYVDNEEEVEDAVDSLFSMHLAEGDKVVCGEVYYDDDVIYSF